MKKLKTIISVIIAICLLAAAVLLGLIFMGVVNLPQKNSEESIEESEIEEGKTNKTESTDEWEIIFKGFEFKVKKKGKALVHESGCLNIRSCEEYLIQIDVDDTDVEEFWENRAEKTENMKKAGSEIELEPQKITVDKKEYIEYRLIIDSTYYEILLSGAGDGKHIMGIAVFDGIDMTNLDENGREEHYETAISEITTILKKAKPTDKKDDAAGSGWEEKTSLKDLEEDTIKKGETSVSYKLPEGFIFYSENIGGKGYYSEQDDAYVETSIIQSPSSTASEYAESKSLAGISPITSEGEFEVNGLKYYYYSYSVKRVESDEEKYEYKFAAYTDLEGGDIYLITGYSQTAIEIMEAQYFKSFMEIKASKTPETPETAEK